MALALPGATGTLKDFLELLVLLGLCEEEASFVQEILAIDLIQAFVSVDVKELWELLILLGMSTGHAERITEGFKTFVVNNILRNTLGLMEALLTPTHSIRQSECIMFQANDKSSISVQFIIARGSLALGSPISIAS